MKILSTCLRLTAILAVALPSLAPATEAVTPDLVVTEIVTHNPELAFYEAEIEAARAARQAATARPDPELSVSLGRKRVTDAGLSAAGTAWSVSVAQTFEWPGRLALRKAIANHDIALAELGLARFKAALAARASVLAHGLHAAREQAAAAAEVAARYRELREVFLQRDPGGITPLLETRVIEAQELTLQKRATEAQLAAQAALMELNQLRGVPVDAPLAVAPARLALRPAPAIEALLAAARENNLEFRTARLELEQQGFAVSLARHERRPGVTVSPFLSQESAGERERVLGVGLSVPLPVSARGTANVASAEARRRQAEVAALLAERRLETEVRTTAAAFEAKLAEMAGWAPDSAARFREAAALADRHYRLGAVPLATYVELQNSYLDAVEALLATEREALEAGLRLRALTGLDFNPAEVKP
ncbi:MAG: TolC family protein [Opitutaceae bacterium]|nr:TolC family protein [Opitutaceae bacterium]